MASSNGSPTCPVCKAVVRPGSAFCGHCGASLAPRPSAAVPPRRGGDSTRGTGATRWVNLHSRGALIAAGLLVGLVVVIGLATLGSSDDRADESPEAAPEAIAVLNLVEGFALPVETGQIPVGSYGSSLTLGDGAELVIPHGSLPAGATAYVRRFEPGIEYLSFTVGKSAIYEIRAEAPDGGTLDQPVVLRVPGLPDRTAVLEFTAGTWAPVPSTPDGEFVAVHLDHFSTRWVMALGASGLAGLRTVGEAVGAWVPRWDLRAAVQQQEAEHRARIQKRSKPTRDFFGVGETTTRTHAQICEEFRTVVTARKDTILFGQPPGSPGKVQLIKHLGDAGKPSAGDSSARWFWDLTSASHAEIRARIVAAADGGRISPAQVLGLAIDLYGGNIPVAVLAVHNTLKDITYEGRNLADPNESYTGGILDVSPEYGAVAGAIETWRRQSDHSPTGRYDKLGPLYHIFAAMTARVWGGRDFGQAAISVEAVLRTIGWEADIPDPEKGAADECGLEIGAWIEELKGEFAIFFEPAEGKPEPGKAFPLTLGIRNLPEDGISINLTVVEGEGTLSTPALSVSPGRGTNACTNSGPLTLCGLSVTPAGTGAITVEAKSGKATARISLEGRTCVTGVPQFSASTAASFAYVIRSSSFEACVTGDGAPVEGTVTWLAEGENFFRFGNGPKEDLCTYRATITLTLTGTATGTRLQGTSTYTWAYDVASLQGECKTERATPTSVLTAAPWSGTLQDGRLRIAIGTAERPEEIILEGTRK